MPLNDGVRPRSWWFDRRARSVLLAGLLALLAGCGTQVEVWQGNGHEAARQALAFSTLVLAVSSDLPGAEEAVTSLAFALETELLYRQKRLVPRGGDIRLAVRISHLKDVPRETRVWLGSLAGSAELRADIRVTGPRIKPFTFSIEAQSRGATTTEDFLSGKGGSTEELTQRAAAIIVGELLDPDS